METSDRGHPRLRALRDLDPTGLIFHGLLPASLLLSGGLTIHEGPYVLASWGPPIQLPRAASLLELGETIHRVAPLGIECETLGAATAALRCAVSGSTGESCRRRCSLRCRRGSHEILSSRGHRSRRRPWREAERVNPGFSTAERSSPRCRSYRPSLWTRPRWSPRWQHPPWRFDGR